MIPPLVARDIMRSFARVARALALALAASWVARPAGALNVAAVGGDVSCRVGETGKAWCIGRGDTAQLGPAGSNGPAALPLATDVRGLSVAPEHSCAILDMGALVCFGANSYARTGDNSTIDQLVPAAADLPVVATGVVSVSTGFFHSCAVDLDNTVLCWGLNYFGATGVPGAVPGDGPVPVAINETADVFELTSGLMHTCYRTSTGRVKCWGQNQFGQLGYGHVDHIGDDETPEGVGYVSLGGLAAQVVAGGLHTCAVLESGDVVCWGDNTHGQLGRNSTATIGDDELPSDVGAVDLNGTLVASVAVGGLHTCVVTGEGRVICWGRNNFGQLGYGHTSDIGDDEPAFAGGFVDLPAAALQLSAGVDHTCAVLVDDTTICWGRGDQGQLANNGTDNVGDDETPADVGVSAYFNTAFPTPTPTPTPSTTPAPTPSVTPSPSATPMASPDPRAPVNQIAAGREHTCAVRYDGQLVCWGKGDYGRLGYGDTETVGDDEIPARKGAVPVGDWVTQVAAGDYHTCTIVEGGKLLCWGYGADGQLGYRAIDDIGDDEVPASMGYISFGLPVQVTQVAAGMTHTCALTADGFVFCWGYNADGQLGLGNAVSQTEPTTFVFLAQPATQITAGGRHACAILVDGNLLCWGNNNAGQLGFGDMANVGVTETPAEVGLFVDVGGAVEQVSAGQQHTCVVRATDHGILCFGSGRFGRLGYGNINNIGDDEYPVDAGTVDIGGPALQVSAGGEHTCAVRQDGGLLCWGLGTFGRLGYGDPFRVGDDETPASKGVVDTQGSVVAVSAGFQHTCALRNDQGILCFGFGLFGQLGYGASDDLGDNEVTALTVGTVDVGARSTPSPSPTPTNTPTPSSTPTASATPTPSVSPSTSASASPSTTASATPSPSPEPEEEDKTGFIVIVSILSAIGATLIVLGGIKYYKWKYGSNKPSSGAATPAATPATGPKEFTGVGPAEPAHSHHSAAAAALPPPPAATVYIVTGQGPMMVAPSATVVAVAQAEQTRDATTA